MSRDFPDKQKSAGDEAALREQALSIDGVGDGGGASARRGSDAPADADARGDAGADVEADGDAQSSGNGQGGASGYVPELTLTDFVDLASLQEVQDSFTALTRLPTVIVDSHGRTVTEPTDPARRAISDQALDWLIDGDEATPGGDQPLIAPILVDGYRFGSIIVERHTVEPETVSPFHIAQLRERVKRLGLRDEQVESVVTAAIECLGANRAAGVQFLHVLANSLARLCYQEYQLRQRLDELGVLYKLTTILAGHTDLQHVLDTAARSAAEVMNVRAVMIRLLDPTSKELIARSVYGLSTDYLNKGPVLLHQSELAKAAFRDEVVYIEDMHSDRRIVYPQQARNEGLVSLLAAGMRYQDQQVGLIETFTAERRRFSESDVNLLRAVGQMLAAAIETTRLNAQKQEAVRLQRQLALAADVQKRMLPSKLPEFPGLDMAARCVPSFELGGDFYDVIDLDGNIGIVVGDVVGKGIAASLLMASVRASLLAYAQDVFDIDQIVSRVNIALSRDTLDNEFATLWYGVYNPTIGRLTYCNAGHEPPILIHRGELYRLEVGGMIVGVDSEQMYDKGLFDVSSGDTLLVYTDGLLEAMNFNGEKFGRERITNALRQAEGKSARDMLNHILWEMRRFVGLNRSNDDTTLVVIKFNEAGGGRGAVETARDRL